MNHIRKRGLLAKRNLLICITLVALFFIDSSVGYQVAYAQLPQPYLVKDINTRTLRSDPFGFTGVNGILYFAADDSSHGSELWRSDGTAAGTQSLAQVSYDTSLVTTSRTFFFIGYTLASGEELWGLNAAFERYSFLPIIGQ